MPENLGEQFLHKRDSTLHTSQPVEHEVERRKLRGETVSQKPADKITNWLEVVKRTHTGHRDDERVLERIKDYYHREHVIQESDIPESYFKTQRRLAREQGHGDIELSPEMRRQLSKVIITDQQSTLDNWVDYLTSDGTDHYPTWAKYWVFNGMLQLSTYDKLKHAFAKRGKDTVAPFPDLNREALAYVMDTMEKKVTKENLTADDIPELHSLLQSANFGKLYVYAMEKVTPTEENELLRTDGEWVVYPQYSDHMPLVQSLQGHGTGWCTAGESTAQAQLQSGDFHIYYSYDKEGKPTIPRVAIRMSGPDIAEVRGIAHEQNLDPYIGDVVQTKLREFPDGDLYQKRSSDMKKLTDIDSKVKDNVNLTDEELRFLYQINYEIEGFGNRQDPRINELLANRNRRTDMATIFECQPDQVSLTMEEALEGGKKVHFGDLNISLSMKHLLELVSAGEGLLSLPEHVMGDFAIYDDETAVHLRIDEDIQLPEGLDLPKSISGNCNLNAVKKSDGLTLPSEVGGHFSMTIKSANSLYLPATVGGDVALPALEQVIVLFLPDKVGGDLVLSSLISYDQAYMPQHVGGDIDLRALEKIETLELPETVGGNINLSKLLTAGSLRLPKEIKGSILLNLLESAKGVVFPDRIERALQLESLSSAISLSLPSYIGNDLDLEGLKSADGLVLPEHVGGEVWLRGLSNIEIERLKSTYPNLDIS